MGIFNSEGLTPNIVQKVRLISDIYRLVDMGAGLCIMSYSPKRQFYNSFELKFIPIRASDPSILEHPKTLAWCSELSPAAKKLVKTAKAMYDQS